MCSFEPRICMQALRLRFVMPRSSGGSALPFTFYAMRSIVAATKQVLPGSVLPLRKWHELGLRKRCLLKKAFFLPRKLRQWCLPVQSRGKVVIMALFATMLDRWHYLLSIHLWSSPHHNDAPITTNFGGKTMDQQNGQQSGRNQTAAKQTTTKKSSQQSSSKMKTTTKTDWLSSSPVGSRPMGSF